MQVSEIRSYRLSDDGNQVETLSNIFTNGFSVSFCIVTLVLKVTLMMKDGTTHNTLIFLDEGDFSFLTLPN